MYEIEIKKLETILYTYPVGNGHIQTLLIKQLGNAPMFYLQLKQTMSNQMQQESLTHQSL